MAVYNIAIEHYPLHSATGGVSICQGEGAYEESFEELSVEKSFVENLEGQGPKGCKK